MLRLHFTFILFSTILFFPASVKAVSFNPLACSHEIPGQDSVLNNQKLYNGRIWRDTYNSIDGTPFLFSDKFLPGSVKMNGVLFHNLRLRYDIFNDELMIITKNNNIVQLNKEMVEGFTMNFESKSFSFAKFQSDIISLNGFACMLYEGKTALIVKYTSELARLNTGIKESFVGINKIFVLKDGVINPVKNKKDIKRLFSENSQRVKNYMRSSRIKISPKEPETFIPVMKFYDSISQ